MNKSQYLAELGQLLVFMTRVDRERTLARYGALFDEAGPAREEELLGKIGTPTRSAIRLSRIYDPLLFTDRFMDELEASYAAPPEPEPEATQPEEEAAPDVVEGLPDLDVPPMVMDDLSAFSFPPAPEKEDQPAPAESQPKQPAEGPDAAKAPASPPEKPASRGPAPASRRMSPPPIVPPSLDDDIDDQDSTGPLTVIERSIPLWLGVPLFILSILLLAVPIAAILLAVMAVLLAPGLILLLFTWLAAVGGLWCISYIADAVMLFGLAFLILGLALIVLWCGLRLDTGIVKAYILACKAMTHLTLGKKVTRDA